MRDHIGAEVIRPADLVEDLTGDRPDGHRAPGVVVLADHRGPVGRDLSPREANVRDTRDLLEEGVVPAGRLGGALDDVTGDDSSGQRIEVVASPSVVMGCWTAHHSGVGHPAGDNDVRSGGERLDDSPTAEIGVR